MSLSNRLFVDKSKDLLRELRASRGFGFQNRNHDLHAALDELQGEGLRFRRLGGLGLRGGP